MLGQKTAHCWSLSLVFFISGPGVIPLKPGAGAGADAIPSNSGSTDVRLVICNRNCFVIISI